MAGVCELNDYRALFEAIPGLCLALSPDLIILNATNAYLEATEVKREEAVGKHIFDVFPDNPADIEATGVAMLRHSLQEVIRTRQPHTMAVQRYDIKVEGGAFEVRHWSPVNAPVLGADGELIAIIHRVEDVTGFVVKGSQEEAHQDRMASMEREIVRRSMDVQAANKRLTELNLQLQQSEARARELANDLSSANHELESFSYSVSHDLRSPLRSMSGFATILKQDLVGKLDESDLDHLDRIIRASQKMSDLIDALLGLSRIGHSKVDKERIELHEVVSDVIADLSVRHPSPTPSFSVDSGLLVWGNLPLIRVLFDNLISNAIKFSIPKGTVKIEIGRKETDGEVAYFVADKGVGFDSHQADRIFEPFERAHSQKEFQGTGIGLAICAKIVRRHGGRIWAESVEGQGTSIFFTLPPP